MKNTFVAVFLLLAATSYAGQKAITDTGKEVILHNDGTWEYFDNAKKVADVIKTNKKKYKKPRGSSFFLKSTRNNSAYWVNADKWSFGKAKANQDAEYQFQLKGKDLYGLAITEGIEVSPESLTDLAFQNMQEIAQEAKVVKKEYRNVNGKKVIYMESSGVLQGIRFTYLGYYYSDASGATQLIAYTSTNLVKKYKSEIEDFLNGLATQ